MARGAAGNSHAGRCSVNAGIESDAAESVRPLVAREGQKLHFDLSHHKCIFYGTIGKLAAALEKAILELFGPGDRRGA